MEQLKLKGMLMQICSVCYDEYLNYEKAIIVSEMRFLLFD